MSENYEVEKELITGKYMAQYESPITYPVGAHIYMDGQIYEVIRSISGNKAPADKEYWIEYSESHLPPESVSYYSQFSTYYPDDIVSHNDVLYKCLVENGYKFNDIRIPLVNGWVLANFDDWQPMNYEIWDVVKYEGAFYTLMSLAAFDNNKTPFESDNWGAIADYTSNYNEYESV